MDVYGLEAGTGDKGGAPVSAAGEIVAGGAGDTDEASAGGVP